MFLCGDRRLSLITVNPIQITSSDGSAGRAGERAIMSNAYIIEIGSYTAGIVTRVERSFRFFSSDRIFDSLEGHEFRSARDAERAARALFLERRHLVSGQLFAAF